MRWLIMAGFWDKEEIVGKIEKNNREEIHIKKVSKNNRDYLDIRTFWYDANDESFKPSQKGVAIPMDLVPELKDILNNVDES
jgi:hypothetical protein